MHKFLPRISPFLFCMHKCYKKQSGYGHHMKNFNPVPRVNPEVVQYFNTVYGVEKAQLVFKALCTPPKKTCLRVNTLKTSTQEVVQQLRTMLDADVSEVPLVPHAVMIHGKGPCTVDYNQSGMKEIIIDRKAGEAVLRGADVFIPGVLASNPGLAVGDRVAVSVALERSGSERCGITRGTTFSTEEDLPVDVPDRKNLYIGIGISAVSRTQLFREKEGLAIKIDERVYELPSCSGILFGSVSLQNLPSVVAAMVLEPKPDWRVLDMCAAPGGKTTAIAQQMSDRGEVIALDRTHTKANLVADYAQELGCTCVKTYKMDARKALWDGNQPQQSNGNQQIHNEKVIARMIRKAQRRQLLNQQPVKEVQPAEQGKGFKRESFDGVLLDAPCSALGLRPRLLHGQTMKELLNTAKYQRHLLDVAVQLVKPGGTLVYSTCTINPGENEANVRYVLDKHPFMALGAQSPKIGGPGLTHPAGVIEMSEGSKTWLSQEESVMVQRFDPCDEGDTIGFFIAKFVKSSL